MSYNRLTARVVKQALKPGPKPRRYGDGGGLWLVVAPSGSASWLFRATIAGRRREMGLGSARTVTLPEASERAIDAARSVARGRNPIDETRARKSAGRAAPSFADCVERVIEDRKGAWKRAAASESSWRNTLGHADKLGPRPVAEIEASEVHDALMSIWNDKPETARKLLHMVKAVFDSAVSRGFRADNPANTLRLPKVVRETKHHESLPYGEVGNAIKHVRACKAGATTKLALEFLALTAARSGEVREAKWDEIDLNAREWRIDAKRMKANKSHRVPLSTRAVEILMEAKQHANGNELVFPSPKTGNAISALALRKLMPKASVHGLRSSFRCWCAEKTDYAPEVCEAALAHAKGSVEAAYNRTDLLAKRRALMSEWSAFLAA